jgi:hypothetical protein
LAETKLKIKVGLTDKYESKKKIKIGIEKRHHQSDYGMKTMGKKQEQKEIYRERENMEKR